jgi:hypothetical protein
MLWLAVKPLKLSQEISDIWRATTSWLSARRVAVLPDTPITDGTGLTETITSVTASCDVQTGFKGGVRVGVMTRVLPAGAVQK